MNNLRIFLVFFTALAVFAGELRPLDPDQALFQTNGSLPDFMAKLHPGLDEVEKLTAAEVLANYDKKQKQKRLDRLWDRGVTFLTFGLPSAILGFIAVGALAQYGWQAMGKAAFYIGFAFAVSGVYFMIMAQHWFWTVVLFVVAALIVIVEMFYSTKLKDKGIEIPKLRKPKK